MSVTSQGPTLEGNLWIYVPQNCSNQAPDPSQANDAAAADFNIDRWSEYVQTLMIDLAPGIALGSLAFALFLLFIFWIWFRWRRRGTIRAARLAKASAQAEEKEQEQQAQFLSSTASGEGNGVAAAVPSGASASWTAAPDAASARAAWRRSRRHLTAGRLLRWTMLLFGAAVIGVSIWGLVQSIKATHGLIPNAWEIVRNIETLVNEIEESLANTGKHLTDLAVSVKALQGLLQSIVNLVASIPLLGNLIPLDTVKGFLGDTATQAVNGMQDAATVINNEILPTINDDIKPALQSVLRNEGWTTSIQDTWRFVVIAVLFGLLIIFVVLVAATAFRMRLGMTATVLVALLWLLIVIVQVLGLGILNGARSIADSACLYSEDLVYRRVNESLASNPDTQETVLNALDYYFGRVNLTDSKGNQITVPPNGTEKCTADLTASLLSMVTNLDLRDALTYAYALSGALPGISSAISAIPLVPNSIKDPFVNSTAQLDLLLNEACNLTLLLVRENRVWPIYLQAKRYLCCELTQTIYDVWVPWVVAGVLAIVFAFLASARIIASTVYPHHMAASGIATGSGGLEAAKSGEGGTGPFSASATIAPEGSNKDPPGIEMVRTEIK